MNPMLFCHIAWMRKYQGEPEIEGEFERIKKLQDGGERWNFKPYRERMYGCAHNKNIDVRKLADGRGGRSIHPAVVSEVDDNELVYPVDVVWTATRPKEGGRVVVGWYRNATVFRRKRTGLRGARRPDFTWRIEADAVSCKCLEKKERILLDQEVAGHLGRRHCFVDGTPFGKSLRTRIEKLFAARPPSEEFERRQLGVSADHLRTPVTKPIGNKQPSRKLLPTVAYGRSPEVSAWVKAQAKGKCELCGKRSFKTVTEQWYLEIHHVKPLAEGGSDVPGNTVALCPNCHRRAHYGEDKEPIRKQLREGVKRR